MLSRNYEEPRKPGKIPHLFLPTSRGTSKEGRKAGEKNTACSCPSGRTFLLSLELFPFLGSWVP
jgi:hypothetical protein